MTARVVYFDGGAGIWELRQGGGAALSVTNANSGEWLEVETVISNTVSLQLTNTGSEGAVFHMLELKRIEPSIVSLSFQAVDDTFVAEPYPDQNLGNRPDLVLKSNLDKTILVKFDANSLTGKVASARLRLYSMDLDGLATVRRVPDSSWDEDSVTWNTKPYFGDTFSGSYAAPGQWCEWDVSAVVTNAGIYSFAIENELGNDHYFQSKEGGASPELVVNVYDAAGN